MNQGAACFLTGAARCDAATAATRRAFAVWPVMADLLFVQIRDEL